MDLIDDPSSSKYLAIFEVPGMKTENMTLQIHNGHLIVKGERKSPYLKPSSDTDNKLSAATDASSEEATQVKKEDLPHITTPVQELRFGAFHRAIPVPKGIKVSNEVTRLIPLSISYISLLGIQQSTDSTSFLFLCHSF